MEDSVKSAVPRGAADETMAPAVKQEAAEARNGLSRRLFLKGALAAAATTGAGPAAALAQAAGRQISLATAAAASKPTIYLIATAHNDTQWNWTVQHTIRDCIPATMRPNWDLFKKYPDYNFNYEGVIHYMFFKEYHPEDWPELQDWVRRGRWKLSGSWINAVDVNLPSPESLFRQALYGQQFFRREFGQVSRDIYLPDCFGFPYSLPSIGRHSGLNSFSTQKLSWGAWIPAPFSVGRWEGADGSQLVSALRPGDYTTRIRSDIATNPRWQNDFSDAGDREVDLRYFGTGDQGGTPDEESVQWAQTSVQDQTGTARVLNTSADQLAKDLTPSEIAALPHYKGELVMKTHGVGCYTSQAARKKWNRMNEQMADAAERASLAAAWLGGPAYPHELLRAAWIRTLWHQFHDDLTGTCIPQAYTFSWNDDLINLNQFSQAVTAGTAVVAQHLDTRVDGIPIVVYNALDQPRRDVVEATIALPPGRSGSSGGATLAGFKVYDAGGKETPGQILSQGAGTARILFQANVPPLSWTVYRVLPVETPFEAKTNLSVSENGLENGRYRVAINEAGDIASVYDKEARVELLSQPTRLEQMHDYSPNWPAWEILWDTVHNPPSGTVSENPRVRVVEAGPVRVAVEVTRGLGDSTFVQHIRLAAEGDQVEVHNHVDWRTPGTLVKAAFSVTGANPVATYDLGLGTIDRPNARPNLYEVNAQQWADVTAASGQYGLAILTNYKYGWDKPDDSTLRLTLIRTPDSGGSWQHQETNDIGHHSFDYALAGHTGDWRRGEIPQRAARFNQPLRAFQTSRHFGAGGRSFSLLRINTPQVAVRAMKKAEDSDEWVIRLQELHGNAAPGVVVNFAAPIVRVREINAAEESIGAYRSRSGALEVDFGAYQPRSFAVTLARAPHRIAQPSLAPLSLPHNLDGVSLHGALEDGAFNDRGETYPGELWPDGPGGLVADGIPFVLGSASAGMNNMVACQGQVIRLPAGVFNRVYFLAASVDGDQSGAFVAQTARGERVAQNIGVQDWSNLIGQWDSRLESNTRADGGPQIVKDIKDGKVVNIEKMKPAYVKRDNIAWVGSHRHSPAGDEAYMFCYLFKYAITLPGGAVSVTLPNNPKIRLMAMTAAHSTLDETMPAGVLFEPELTDATIPRKLVAVRLPPGSVVFRQSAMLALDGKRAGFDRPGLAVIPTDRSAPWTMNLFVRTDAPPEKLTLIAGFGDGSDTQGAQRYIARVNGGIEFWGSSVDIDSGEPFDTGKWQMLSAVFNGRDVTLYKNAEVIKTAPAVLDESSPEVQIGPLGPWPGSHQFAGQIQGFTIWNSALTPGVIQKLMASMPTD